MFGSFPERGDVYTVKAPHGNKGHEQDGARYAVVLQSSNIPLSTLIVAPTSSSRSERSFRPLVTINDTETCVLVEHILSVSPEHRLGRFVGRLSLGEMQQIDRAICMLILDEV